MKKVGIVSCYSQPNYGSMLQAYATQLALDKLGYENEIINISGFNREIQKAKLLYFAKAALTSGILSTKLGRAKSVAEQKLGKSEYAENMKVRNAAFQRFENQYFKMSPTYHSKKELGESCDRYQTVLAGSDQLWLPGNIAADYFTLNFVPENINTIAYATSFGQATLPSDSTKLAEVFLKKIKHISVREESGSKLVKKIADRNVPVVCDPTLLFDAEEWNAIQENKALVDGEYIFAYFLGNNSLHRKFVERLKKETGLQVVCLPHIDEFVKQDESCSDVRLYNIDPAQFLNLIRNARYVCTDSFHCSAFSMEYKKDFFTFKRFPDGNRLSTNSRIDTLFHLTGMRERLLTGNEDMKAVIALKTDWTCVHEKLKKGREESYQYLIAALEDKGSTDCD